MCFYHHGSNAHISYQYVNAVGMEMAPLWMTTLKMRPCDDEENTRRKRRMTEGQRRMAIHRKHQYKIMKRPRPTELISGICYDMDCMFAQMGPHVNQNLDDNI